MGNKISVAQLLKMGVSAFVLMGSVAWAEDDKSDAAEMDEVIAVGSRLPSDLTTFAGSVTVIGLEELDSQTKITSDLGEILGNMVPGMAISKGSSVSNFGQMLRGRKPAVLIDGSPQTVPIREASRDLRLISPAAIGRIEVIRGSSALYGMGGAGGVINYITKRPTDEGLEFRTDVGFGASLSNLDSKGFSYNVSQALTGKQGPIDFVLTAFYEEVGSIYDAQGEMISPDPGVGQGGTSDMTTTSFFGKVGLEISEEQRFEVSYGRYRAKQDTDYFYNFLDFTSTHQTAILKSELPVSGYDEGYIIDSKTENDFASFAYSHEDILGSSLRLSGSYQKYEAVFGNSPFFLWGLFPSATNPYGGGQTVLRSKKYGLRLDIDTPIEAVDGRILWGVDYLTDTTSQDIYDSGAHYLSPVDQNDISLFAQFEGSIVEGVNFRGGFRWVNFKADVPDYTTLPFYLDGYVEDGVVMGAVLDIIGGNAVMGRVLKYSLFLPNIGLVVDVDENWKVFGSYSKGFLIADLGRTLRSSYFVDNLEGLQNEPQVVATIEGGLRAFYENVTFEIAGYRSTSEAGTTLEIIPSTGVPTVVRAPERIWGAEVSVDWAVNDKLNIMASYSWTDGVFNRPDDGNDSFEQLHSSRIPPQKFITQVKYQVSEDWSIFVQGLYSFDHKLFGETIQSGPENPIDGFFLLDASVTGKVGPGYLSVSVSNLLNNDYEPIGSQAVRDDPQLFYKAAGAELSVRYSIEY